MAWYDRIGKIASGVVDLGSEVVELGIDIAKAPFVEDEYEGIGNTIIGIMQDNVIGGVLSTAIGPEGALGSAIGGLPEGVRAPIRSFNNEVIGRIDAWQDAYIERPLAAAVMGYHLATSSGLAGWADTDTWATAWQIADDGLPPGEYDLSLVPENQQELFTKGLSLGRAVAFATMGTDVLNPQLAAEAAQSSTFNLISGAVDFGETLILDPLLWAGKPLQAVRAGKATLSTAVDASQAVRRTKRATLSPSYSLVPQKGGKFGATFKLTPQQVANFTSRRANEVVNSANWSKLNGYIARNLGRVPDGAVDDIGDLSDAHVAARLADETDSLQVGNVEYEDLMNQRATEIRRTVGEKNMTQETARGLADATNETMRSNHYRYMAGDFQAGREAAKAATEHAARMRALRESEIDPKQAPFGAPQRTSVVDQIEDATSRVERARLAYKRRQGSHKSAKERGHKVDEAKHSKAIGEQLDELGEAVARRDELVARAREAVQGDGDWDFGFIMDLKTRFDGAQIDNLAARRAGAYGNDVAGFLARNGPENVDLIDAAVDRWLLDSLGELDDAVTRIDDLGEGGAAIQALMREGKTLDRQILGPMSMRANNAISGVAARTFEGAAKAVQGRRRVQWIQENTTQRFINTDDVLQSTNQFERMVRDVQRMVGGELMDADEAARLINQWGRLERGDQRLAMFQSVVEEINKRFAQHAGMDDVDDLAKVLSEQYHAANQMLRQAKPSGGRFGATDRSRVNIDDGNGSTTSISMPLSQRQLTNSLIVPRYDLLDEAWKASRPDGTVSRKLRQVVDELGLPAVKKGASNTADLMMQVWRPAVLLRPAWPLRVVGDEALRVMSVVGAIPQLRAMSAGMKDLRVEMMRRKGIDVEAVALRRMRKELELPDNTGAWDVYKKYSAARGEDAISKLYLEEVNKMWGATRRAKGMAARGALGWLLLGPLGGIGAATVSAATASRTARRLAQRQIGETFGVLLRQEADVLIGKAARSLDPEAARNLRDAADLLLVRERNLKQVMKTYGIDEVDEDSLRALTVADAAGARLEQAGRSPTMIGGVLVRNAVGEDTLNAQTIQSRVSADRSTQALVRGASEEARGSLDPAVWEQMSLTVDNAEEFARAWERSVNMQWRAGADATEYGNRYLKEVWSTSADTMDEYKHNLLNFLESSDGRKILEDLRVPDSQQARLNFVDAVAETSNQILPQFSPVDGRRLTNEFDSFRKRLGEHGEELSWKQVDKARKRLTPDQRLAVDGKDGLGMNMTVGQVGGVTPKAGGLKQLMEWTNSAFQVLATLPTDNLSRLPFFRASYDREVARRLSFYVDPDTGQYVLEGKNLQRIINRAERSARDAALEDVRYLLYDLTEKTRTQENMANMMPFLGAWQEVISRWVNITKENPAYVARVLDNYNSIPIAEDDEGNRWMVWRFPTVLEDIGMAGPLLKPFSGQNLKFSQDGMSMLSSGGPGFGPLITIPITEIAVQEPTLEEALEFIWPYGLPQGTSTSARVLGQLGPAWMKRAKGVIAGSDELERIVLQVARDRMVTHRDAPPIDGDYPNRYAELMADPQSQNQFMSDIRKDARALLAARAFASTTMPTSMMVASPYQFYLDQYRALRKDDPLNADDRFIDQFGAEFFAIVQRTTKTNNGVSPTIQSWEEFQKYEPLIQSYPEIGALVTGVAGSDMTQRFNEAVYRRQQSESVSPGSPKMQRERVPLQDFIEGADVKEGWTAYRHMIDVRNAELAARATMGASKSLNAKANTDVRDWYQFEMERLQQNFPAWYRTFSVTDKLKDTRKLSALRAVAEDPVLSLRPEIEDLQDYFADRQIVIDELKAREAAGGSKSLTASQNADVAEWWEYTRMEYRDIEEFKDLFDRYLSRDQVSEVTWGS